MTSRLVLLGGQAVAFGLTIAFLVVPASALFLARYGAASLPYAYLAVAVAGVAVTLAMRTAQRRISLPALAVSVLGSYLLLVTASWLLLILADAVWVTFALLVLFPLSIPIGFLLIGAQGVRLLDVRQMKTYFPRVVGGFAVGFGLGGLLAAWLVHPLGGPEHLLGVDAAAVLCLLGLVVITARRHPAELLARPDPPAVGDAGSTAAAGSSAAAGPAAAGPAAAGSAAAAGTTRRRRAPWRDPLVGVIFGYQLLSAAVTQLLDYMVWERAAAQFSEPAALARFQGIFGAVINFVGLAFVALIAWRLLTRFGLGLGLAANPIGVLALLAVTTVVGYAGGTTGAVLLVAVCVCQVVDLALTDGMTRTAIATTYQALPPEHRLRSQTLVEGAGVPLALGLVGGLLLLFRALSLDVRAVGVFTLVLSLLWLAIALRGFREYSTSLRTLVVRPAWGPQALAMDDEPTRRAVARLLEGADIRDVRTGLAALVDRGRPGQAALADRVRALLADPDPERRAMGIDFGVRAGIVGLSPAAMVGAILPDPEGSGRIATGGPATGGSAIGSGGIGADGIGDGEIGDDDVLRQLPALLDDPAAPVRYTAAAVLARSDGDVGERAAALWRSAARSTDPDLVAHAMTAAAVAPGPRLVTDLVALAGGPAPPPGLADALTANAALLAPVLTAGGPLASESAEPGSAGPGSAEPRSAEDQARLRSARRRIISALGESDAPDRDRLLSGLLGSPDRTDRLAAAQALAAGPGAGLDPAVLRAALRPESERAARVLAVLADLDAAGADPADPGIAALRRALGDELTAAGDHAAALLAAAYGTNVVASAISLLTSDDRNRGLALEMLEITVGQAVARPALALIDPAMDPARRRSALPAVPSGGGAAHWLDDLTADPAGVWQEPWLRACALYAAPALLGLVDAAAVAFPWLEDADPVVAETARWVVAART